MTMRPGHRIDRGGHLCAVDTASRHVAVTTGTGALVHESSCSRSLRDIEKAGIKAPLLTGSHPGGRPDKSF